MEGQMSPSLTSFARLPACLLRCLKIEIASRVACRQLLAGTPIVHTTRFCGKLKVTEWKDGAAPDASAMLPEHCVEIQPCIAACYY